MSHNLSPADVAIRGVDNVQKYAVPLNPRQTADFASEAPPLTLLERTDNIIQREANRAAAVHAEVKRAEAHAKLRDRQMERAKFETVLR